ncbi:MAG TPA: ester cyclase [bacterium]|jgi:ketosteroid isomerase-like protein
MAGNEKDNLKQLKDVYDGFNKGDLERMRMTLTDNATLYLAAMDQTLKGPSTIIDYFRQYKQAFDATISPTRQVACADLVLSEFVGKGIHQGVFHSPSGDIPPTGKTITIPVCHILQWKDGKIVDIHEYFDAATLMSQLGIGLTQEHHTY